MFMEVDEGLWRFMEVDVCWWSLVEVDENDGA